MVWCVGVVWWRVVHTVHRHYVCVIVCLGPDYRYGIAWSHLHIDMYALRCNLQMLTKSLLGASTPKSNENNRELAEVLGWADAPVHWGKKLVRFMQKEFPCARYVQVGNRSAERVPNFGNTSLVYVLNDTTPKGFTKVLRWLGVNGCKFKGKKLSGVCVNR